MIDNPHPTPGKIGDTPPESRNGANADTNTNTNTNTNADANSRTKSERNRRNTARGRSAASGSATSGSSGFASGGPRSRRAGAGAGAKGDSGRADAESPNRSSSLKDELLASAGLGSSFGGVLQGLGNILGKLSDLAEKGQELQGAVERGGARIAYNVNVRHAGSGSGSGSETGTPGSGSAFRTNPQKPAASAGAAVADVKTAAVHEVLEPLVDLFDEPDGLLIVAELPGIRTEDVQLELQHDILTITASRGAKRYRKEILLPDTFPPNQLESSCRNGILEVRLHR